MNRAKMCKLPSVMHMKENQAVLRDLLKTTQLGQVGIRSALDAIMGPGLRRALESQLREYDSIETEAHAIATRRGWELPELDPAMGAMVKWSARIRLRGRDTDSKIAGMLIQGNTRGMIQGMKHIRQLAGSDAQVQILSQKLLDCEQANIRQMQGFL